MILSELAEKKWFQDNLETLMRTKLSEDSEVKHCIALLANSKFKECSETCELWLLGSEKVRDLWRSGTTQAWLANAYSFATTVAVITEAIIPTSSKVVPKEQEHG